MIAPPKPPSRDELEALIKEARERQLRRRLRGAAAAAIAAAMALSVYAVMAGGGPRRVTADNVGRSGARLCGSNQLSAVAGFQGATETMLGSVTLVNTGASACSLPQQRPRVALSWRGKPLLTAERKMLTGPPWPRAHVLPPGARASVYFQWFTCGAIAPKAAVRPTFTLRFSRTLVVIAHSSDVTPPSCSGLGGRYTLGVSNTLVDR